MSSRVGITGVGRRPPDAMASDVTLPFFKQKSDAPERRRSSPEVIRAAAGYPHVA